MSFFYWQLLFPCVLGEYGCLSEAKQKLLIIKMSITQYEAGYISERLQSIEKFPRAK